MVLGEFWGGFVNDRYHYLLLLFLLLGLILPFLPGVYGGIYIDGEGIRLILKNFC